MLAPAAGFFGGPPPGAPPPGAPPPGAPPVGAAPKPPAPTPHASLKVVTTSLRAGYFRKNGVPYSENAVVTEYYDRLTMFGNDYRKKW